MATEDDAGEFEWELLRLAHLSVPETRGLWNRLRTDYDPDAWGYAQLGDLPERQRAVVSDQLLTSCWSIGVNLIEAHTHLEGFRKVGIATRRPDREDMLDDRRRDYEANATVAGFFRAFGSSLDCLAAVATTVLRAPKSIQRAALTDWQLGGDNGMRRLAESAQETVPEEQRQAWRAFAESLTGQGREVFPDWIQWALQMRHALMHRGRLIGYHFERPHRSRINLIQTDPGGVVREIRAGRPVVAPPASGIIAIVKDAPATLRSLQRFDLHFHRAPWLPEMEQIADQARPDANPWLPEPAAETMEHLLANLSEWTEAAVRPLAESWEKTGSGAVRFDSPVSKWVLPRLPVIDFDGFGGPRRKMVSSSSATAHPDTAKRLELAKKVRGLGADTPPPENSG